jgi:hypothetical protein
VSLTGAGSENNTATGVAADLGKQVFATLAGKDGKGKPHFSPNRQSENAMLKVLTPPQRRSS